jgi:phage gpG-like protein
MSVGIEVTGTDRLLDALDELQLTFRDFRPLLIEASREFYAAERELFDTEGAAGASGASGRWAPLTPQYAARKLQLRPGARILELTGQLRRSLTQPNARFSMRQVKEEELLIGTNDPKAAFHFHGTRRMVARPPVSLTAEQSNRITKVLRDGLIDVVKKRGKFIVIEVG